MAKRRSLKGDPCPVARALDVVGDRWSLLIVRDAFDGIRRFGAFQKNLNVARNILSDRLSRLVDNGILAVQPASDGTAYPEYVLTSTGRALFAVVVTLRQWGEGHLFDSGEPHSHLRVIDGSTQVAEVQVRGADGRVLQPDETRVEKVFGQAPAT